MYVAQHNKQTHGTSHISLPLRTGGFSYRRLERIGVLSCIHGLCCKSDFRMSFMLRWFWNIGCCLVLLVFREIFEWLCRRVRRCKTCYFSNVWLVRKISYRYHICNMCEVWSLRLYFIRHIRSLWLSNFVCSVQWCANYTCSTVSLFVLLIETE